MMKKTILVLSILVLTLFATFAFANPDAAKVQGDFRIMGAGSGLVFPDGSVQYQAATQGPKGDAGPAGPQGIAGANGQSSLVALIDEPAGSNCASGGVKIQSGLDANRDGVLNSNEATQTKFVCNGSANTASTTISVADYAKPVGYLRYNAYPGISHTHYFDGVKTVQGRSVNVLREIDDVGSVLKETVYFSSDLTSGIYLLGANGEFLVNPFPFILPTFVPGKEYGPYDIYGDGSTMAYVTWSFEDVTVPYGSFPNALKQKTRLRSGTTDSISYNWYVKDVGGVKWQDGQNPNDNELLATRNFTWPN